VRLALCDRDETALEELCTLLSGDGVEVIHDLFDARDIECLSGFFERANTVFDERLDVLVNVVGGTFQVPFAESRPNGWDAIIRTNFTWLLHSTQLAIPAMQRAGGGSIINLTSIEAHRGAPNVAVYAAMKAAVTSLGRSLAVELAPDGIRVNAIAPDMIPTEGLRAISRAPLDDRAVRVGVPAGHRGDPDDVGGCVLFLASDLSRYVTGTVLHPDGGTFASGGWFNWPEEGFACLPPESVLRSL
jgi:3-oxoacyl-[acyl-carrier protein] reductase